MNFYVFLVLDNMSLFSRGKVSLLYPNKEGKQSLKTNNEGRIHVLIQVYLFFEMTHFFRAQGPMEFESLKNNVILDLEKAEEKLMLR